MQNTQTQLQNTFTETTYGMRTGEPIEVLKQVKNGTAKIIRMVMKWGPLFEKKSGELS
jgi:hypothetical protein